MQIRCLRIDTEGLEVSFPKWGGVSVNGSKLLKLEQPPENTSARKRVDHPLRVSNADLRCGRNSLDIFCEAKDENAYSNVAVVYLTKNKTPEEWCREVTAYHKEPIKVSVQRAKEFMRPKHEGVELADQNVRMSVKCPMSFKEMKTPVRG